MTDPWVFRVCRPRTCVPTVSRNGGIELLVVPPGHFGLGRLSILRLHAQLDPPSDVCLSLHRLSNHERLQRPNSEPVDLSRHWMLE